MSDTSLTSVIKIDETKCVNCHACITACPVKYCNDGSGDLVTINQDMCIGCGNCITACTHDARNYIDDFDMFINDIIGGDKIVAISSPATAASFPNLYLELNTWLKDLGVEAIFDVSFGAELTTKSYVEYIKKENPKTVIAQPCASIVTYIELYKPELLNCLIPVDSPMLHTIKMINEYYPQYKNHKVAVISPCNAKKREFEETGLGNYNIAHASIQKFLDQNEINLTELHKTDFDNPEAERAVSFSSPGGLLKTAERWIPNIGEKTRKIEGTHLVYDYFNSLPEMVEKGMSPLLVDCLSCEFGCNAGPLTLTKDKPLDEIEFLITKRSSDLKEKYIKENENKPELSKQKIEKTLNKYWEEGLYSRKYVNRWKNVDLKYPTEKELDEIYVSMHKYTDEDVKNCSACGYGTCEGMAVAILNKLNKPENCHFYLSKENKLSIEKVEKSEAKLSEILSTSLDGFVEVDENEVIVCANPAFKKILKKADVIGKSIYEFIDKKDLKTFEYQISQRAKGKFSSYELEFQQSDNSSICCLVSASPILSSGENKGSFAMVSDISELKKSEYKLKKFNENLEKIVETRTAELNEVIEELNTTNEVIEGVNKELEQLSIVAAETNNAIIIMDKDGNFEWVNDAFTKKYGIVVEELISQRGENLTKAYRNVKNINEYFNTAITERKTVTFQYYEADFEGNKIYTQTNLTPIIDFNDNITNIVAVNTDISELKEAEEEITLRNEDLFQRNEEIISQRDEIEKKIIEIEKQHKHITDSINYAKKIQEAMLPANEIFKNNFADFFILFKPRDVVSGDFYWAEKFDNKIIYAVADCTGHGVPGAMVSMLGISLLNKITTQNINLKASEILDQLREEMKISLKQTGLNSNESRDGMDIALCLIDIDTKELQYSGAYNSLYIHRNNKLLELKANRQPIGVYAREKNFTNHEFQLQTNDIVYSFSDGFSDQFNPNREKYMIKRFKQFLVNIADHDLQKQKEFIENEFTEWKSHIRQMDDIVITGIKI